MSSFKRSYLKALGLNEDQVESVMEAHRDVVNEITADRDKYKADADKLPGLQKQLEDEQAKNTGDGEYKKKYEALVAENQTRETRTAKTAAYRSVLEDIGVSEQYIDLLVQANQASIDELEMDGKEIKNASKFAEDLKVSMAKYISETQTKGSDVSNPPKNTGKKPTRDEIMAIKDDAARQQAIAENMDLFQ